ncbi:MAG: FkbM family methyltransferase [Oligoflexia bacterium]|nr:FkbM family methyltransferase [Oligoflexia bacterium]
MSSILKAWSLLPNVKGKLWFGNKLYDVLGKNDPVVKKVKNFSMKLNIEDRIQRRIFFKNGHEPETEVIFERFFRDASCFVDIGGNVGYFSLLAASVNPKIKVVAFEPLPQNISQFKENISLNPGFDQRIEIVEKCLSDEKGEVTFFVPPEGECGWGRMGSADDANGEEHQDWPKISREALSLDEYLSNHTELKPDVFKIDVEGNEVKVIYGAVEYLKNNKVKAFCIELNEGALKEQGSSSEKIIGLMNELGYEAHYINGDQLSKTEKPVVGYIHLNYFFLPKA